MLHLEAAGWHVHNEWVRYVGRGSCIACFHCEPVSPNAVALPPPLIDYSPLLQQDWLRQELQELAKVCNSPLLATLRMSWCSSEECGAHWRLAHNICWMM